MPPYWIKQTIDKPLFNDLLWSKPENKLLAGKLLIVGGNAHGFSAPAEAYSEAVKSGIGTARVLLPDSLQKTIGQVFEAGEFTASTPSGSFSQRAISELLIMSQWSDGVLLAGDFGRNSETAIMLEQVVQKYVGQLTITQDALDYFTKSTAIILSRDNTLIVAAFAQLQKIFTFSGSTTAITFEMDFLKIIEALHNFTEAHAVSVITKHLDTFFIAVNGKVSTTKLDTDLNVWRIKTAAQASTWWLHNPHKQLEALTTSLI